MGIAIDVIQKDVLRYAQFSAAKDFVDNHTTKILNIVYGRDDMYWVVTPRQAVKLQWCGLEVVY